MIRSYLSSSISVLESSNSGSGATNRPETRQASPAAFLVFLTAAAFWAAPTGLELMAVRGSKTAISPTMLHWMSISAVLMASSMFCLLVGSALSAYSQRITKASCWLARVGILVAFSATLSACFERVGAQSELIATGRFTENLEEMAAVWLSALAFLVTLFPWAYSELNRPGL